MALTRGRREVRMAISSSSSTTKLVDSIEQYDNAISWINDTLNTPSLADSSSTSKADLTELDQYITQLLTSLDIACEDTSVQLERIIDDVSRSVPRLAYDLHFMKDGALTLQASLVDVLKKAKDAVPSETSAALDNLHHLDLIKTRMEAARDVLQEAESWSTLEMEVTSLIGERNYAKAAERLSEASKSMVVFQNTPEYDPRRALMVNLQNQLEASLSSALVSAINSQDVATCKEYFSIFSIIQRESEFRNYYNASRRTTSVGMWQSANLSDSENSAPDLSAPSQSFADFLPKFYASFLVLLNAERGPIASIFPDPAATLSHFISSTFSALQPTFSQRLSSFISNHGDTAILQLVNVLQATEEFAIGVWKLMEKLRYSESSPASRPRGASISDRPGSLHRRRSSRMSISWRPGQQRPTALTVIGGGDTNVDNLEWDQELFQPFIDAQVDYASLERRFLDHSLLEIISNDTRDTLHVADQPRLFRERAVDIVGVAEGSLTRCKAFTHGYGAAGLVQALDGFFSGFIDTWTAELESKRDMSKPDSADAASDLQLEDLDYSAKDWSEIQLSFHLLASAKTVSERLNSFETKLRSFVAGIASHFRLAQADPQGITIAATKGETQLLEQSTLNSAELFSLFTAVEQELQGMSTPMTAPHSASFRSGFANQQQQQVAPESLLVQTRKSLSTFAQTCQVSTQRTILLPLRKHLASYSTLPIWGAREDAQKALANDLQIPTFSRSPTEVVRRVAVGLLNLPRLFEEYEDDDSLAFSLQTLPHVDPEILKQATEQQLESLIISQPGQHRRLSAAVTIPKPTSLDPEIVSSAWLVSLGHTFIQHFTDEVLPSITTLTGPGAEQLASDLEYLSNIVRALNVESAQLERWRVAVGCDVGDLRKRVQDGGQGQDVAIRVAKARGWL